MKKGLPLGKALLRRTSFFIAAKISLSLFVLVAAANIVTTTETRQAIVGGHLSVTNNLTAVDKGFAIEAQNSSATGKCPTGNVTFGPALSIANTVLVSGDYVFTVQVGTTGSTAANSCFTATLILTPNGGNPTTYGPVSFATGPSPITSGQTIDCKFDIGTSLPTSPYSFKVTVQ